MSISRREFLHLCAYGFGSAFFAACQGKSPPATAPSPQNTRTLTPTVTTQALQEMGLDGFASAVKTHRDARYVYVESDGMPAHPMMVGIKSWQQQVPLPQPYKGANAWQIPLHPVLADKPISAKNALYRGAIAIAVNGVPIFNALNNRGEDTYLAGELDEWGGHAGRADDYHYHIAPLHLADLVGHNHPIAYALDGYPIYGLTEADGAPVIGLDEFNGHFAKDGSYHYHATKNFPYINGGLRGMVTVKDDQIEPQPRTTPIRDWLQPLKGAVITDFHDLGGYSFALAYQISGQTYGLNYSFDGTTYRFDFVDPDGKKTVKTYPLPRH